MHECRSRGGLRDTLSRPKIPPTEVFRNGDPSTLFFPKQVVFTDLVAEKLRRLLASYSRSAPVERGRKDNTYYFACFFTCADE